MIEPPDWQNDADEGVYGPRPATCKHCGAEDLEWVDVGLGWRLYEGDVLHRCKAVSREEAADFEAL